MESAITACRFIAIGEEGVAAMDVQNHYHDQNSKFRELDRDEMMNVEEPAFVRGKSRPSSKRNKKKKKTFDNSAHREPSAFELAQTSQPAIRRKGGRIRTRRSRRGGRV